MISICYPFKSRKTVINQRRNDVQTEHYYFLESGKIATLFKKHQ
jgi:hypothetical protein